MIARLVRVLLGAAIEGVQRFPVTAVALVVTVIVANVDIAGSLGLGRFTKESLYAALAAFTLASLIKKIGFESRGYSQIYQHGSALLAGALMALLAWFGKDIGLSHFAFFAGLVGAVLVSAHWFRGTSSGFWFFIVRLLFVAGLALAAVCVFALGLSAILGSLDYLFGVNVPGSLYGHVWATSLIAGPLFALGRIPYDFDTLPVIDGDNYGVAGLRLLSDYLAAPMLAIYALILHVYAAKIIITGEVPQNQIGWMVIGYCTALIFFWKVMLPLRGVLTASGRLFLRVWPFLVLVPVALLVYAVWLRIGAYGVTPDRYFLLAFGVLMVVYAAMQMVARLRDWLPGVASLSVAALLLGSLGPWGAEMISVRSQLGQFASILDDKSQVVMGEGRRASNILRFLNRRKALDGLKEVGGKLKGDPFNTGGLKPKQTLYTRLVTAFGVNAARKKGANKTRRWLRFAKGAVSVTGYDLYVKSFTLRPKSGKKILRSLSADLKIRITKEAIVIIHNDVDHSFSLKPILTFAKTSGAKPKAQGFVLRSGDKTILLVPEVVNIIIGPSGTVTSGSAGVFLRSADWE